VHVVAEDCALVPDSMISSQTSVVAVLRDFGASHGAPV